MNFNFRAIWYAVVVWIFSFLTSGVVIAPWFYVVMPLLVLMFTVYYFDGGKIKKSTRDELVQYGLGIAIFWFAFAALFSVFEIVSFYYFDLAFYFSDFKNIYLFPLLLLVPVLYSIALANTKRGKRYKDAKRRNKWKKVLPHF